MQHIGDDNQEISLQYEVISTTLIPSTLGECCFSLVGAEELLAVPRLKQLGFAGSAGKGADFQTEQLHIILKNNLAVFSSFKPGRLQSLLRHSNWGQKQFLCVWTHIRQFRAPFIANLPVNCQCQFKNSECNVLLARNNQPGTYCNKWSLDEQCDGNCVLALYCKEDNGVWANGKFWKAISVEV